VLQQVAHTVSTGL